MKKSVAFFDIDGVIYDNHTIFDIIQDQEKTGMVKPGLWKKILKELEDYKSAKKTYVKAADNMLAHYAKYLKGKKYNVILEYNIRFFSSHGDRFFNYFVKLVPKLKPSHDIYLVTTNVNFTAQAIGAIFKIENYLSTEFETKKGIFTGNVQNSLAGNKQVVQDLVEKYSKIGSIAVGDSENDIGMLDKVELPIAFEPDKKLSQYAKKKSWAVVNRKNAYKSILNLI